MNCKSLFLSIILLFIASHAQASSIKRMYEVSQPVVSQDKQIRNAAFEQGLIEVAMRVSGSSRAPAEIDLMVASQMISQYRYFIMSEKEINAYMKQSASQGTPLEKPRYRLWMKFDDAKVKQQLGNNGLPIWGYQRPNVLIWLAVKDGKNRYLLKKSDQSQIKDTVEKEAHRRGLPIIWPEYDTLDRQQLSFIDVWGEFWEPLKQASQRYKADAVLLGKMNWANGSWQVNWSLLMEDRIESWKLSALDMGMITSSGIDVATDHVSSRFAVYANSANDGELLVRVSDLYSVKNFATVSHYLASLAPVKSVYASEVKGAQVDFYLELSGDEKDLKRIIALGKILQPDTRAEEEPSEYVVRQGQMPMDSEKPDTGVTAVQGIQSDNGQSAKQEPLSPEVQRPQKPQPNMLRYRINS
ncbi:hypothetical protein MNBD_GAMMA09-3036 [hydrothermal vent metagenome]|uniref:DUF2066 domain-containing protein n=1 Tax=hydrothermal vent metagenome TaxID=652676 RepID=A0A3B0XR46_9ZZZZ